MSENYATLSEQASLLAFSTDDPLWLDRINNWDPVARLGDTFLLNSMVGKQPMPYSRLIAPEALERVGCWLHSTLHKRFEVQEDTPSENRSILSDPEIVEILGFDVGQLPEPYHQWRFSVELYLLIDDTIFILMNGQFIHYRRLDRMELGTLFSARTVPFFSDLGEATGVVLGVVAVPGRIGAFGGLRGQRRSLIAAGQAVGWVQHLWEESDVADRWEWEHEFIDDSCLEVFGLCGLERVPIALAFQLRPRGLE